MKHLGLLSNPPVRQVERHDEITIHGYPMGSSKENFYNQYHEQKSINHNSPSMEEEIKRTDRPESKKYIAAVQSMPVRNSAF
jgi:hypothetical protein